MDLLAKVGVAVVIFIVIAGIGFYAFGMLAGQATALTAQKATQIVISDLKLRNPTADVTIISVTPSTLAAGSWSMTFSVVYNSTSPCPTLFIEGFDYPATGLVPSVDNLYTENCTIYGLSTAPTYVISSPAIAIVKSYDSGFAPITNYVNNYGYGNTTVHAKFFATLESNMTPLNRTFYNVWDINYTAIRAGYSQFAILNSSGAIAGNYTK